MEICSINLLDLDRCYENLQSHLEKFKYALKEKFITVTDSVFQQLIVTGDFFQLPPVMKNAEAKFAFEAQLWHEIIEHTFNLTKVFRQTDQGAFPRLI